MGRVDPSQLAKITARLGDAALNPGLWPEIMDEICLATSTTGAVLLQSDIRTPDVPRTAGADEMISNYFENGWHTRDLRVRGVPLLLGGQSVITDQEFTTPEEMSSHPYYQDILLPFDLFWFAGVGFWADSSLWVLCLQRSPREGPFDLIDRKILGELSPRLTEVATLSTAVGRSVISGIADALSAVKLPALALDRMGSVIGTNTDADRLFGEDVGVFNRSLWLRDAAARAELEVLVDRLRSSPETADFSATRIVVRRASTPVIIIRVLPVPPAARGPFLGARAVLTFSELRTAAPAPRPDMIADVFGLTRAEARLASLIAAGTPPAEVARQLGISRETARNHLKSVFSKTETHRQSELVLLLSRL